MLRILMLLVPLLIGNPAFSMKMTKECKDKKIKIYVKARCIYCHKLKEILDENNVDYTEKEISTNFIMHGWLVTATGSNTVPYVYLDDKFIGGYSEFVGLCVEKQNGKK